MLRHFFHLSRAYFELDHRQAKAYLWLLIFTAAIACSPLFTYYLYPAPYDLEDVRLIVDRSEEKEAFEKSVCIQSVASFKKRIDEMKEEDWITAGLPVYLAKRILKYQKKVKSLKRIDDLSAVYGMDSSRMAQVKPFLLESQQKVLIPNKKIKKQEPSLVILDINTIDSVVLEALPAIGPVLSKRILKYRELLKGYATKKQYTEIYGISPEALAVLQKWTEVKNVPMVCSLKTADYQKLNAHFYLSGKDARFILAQLKMKAVCWEELQSGLELKAQQHMEELKLYYPCE